MTDQEFADLRQAAEQGDAWAQNNLGYHFDTEKQDFAAARHWYELAARQGDAAACWNLALMYKHGEGVEVDFAKALEYNIAAGKNGEPDAYYFAALTLDEGDKGVPADPRRANRYYRLAAAAGIPQAAYNLGCNYATGTGVRKDFKKSFSYIRQAADDGDTAAFQILGQCYYFGEGVRKNYAKAFACFKRSYLATKNAASAGFIAECCKLGRGTKRNPVKAFRWTKRSAALGDADSLVGLGIKLILGEGCRRDVEAGRGYLVQAPADYDALYWLGRSHGDDRERALPYFQQVFDHDKDRWAAYWIVRLNLQCSRDWDRAFFLEQQKLLQYAARHQIVQARRLLRSKRWLRLKASLQNA